MRLCQNILFDLGGLFISVYIERFERWLLRVRPSGIDPMLFRRSFDELHHRFERGECTTSEFLSNVSYLLDDRVEIQDIEKAWNSILGTFSVDDLLWVSCLRSSFRTALLSNTNELHRASFEETLHRKTGGGQLSDYFDGVYYSQFLGIRKPDKNVFLRVLELEGWRADETLFVDDNEQNLQSAAGLGMAVLLHPCNAPLRPHLESRIDLPFHQISSLY